MNSIRREGEEEDRRHPHLRLPFLSIAPTVRTPSVGSVSAVVQLVLPPSTVDPSDTATGVALLAQSLTQTPFEEEATRSHEDAAPATVTAIARGHRNRRRQSRWYCTRSPSPRRPRRGRPSSAVLLFTRLRERERRTGSVFFRLQRYVLTGTIHQIHRASKSTPSIFYAILFMNEYEKF